MLDKDKNPKVDMHSVSVSLHFRFFTLNDFHKYGSLLVYFSYFIFGFPLSLSFSLSLSLSLSLCIYMVNSYFSMVHNEGSEDLKVSAGSSLPVYAIAKL